MALPEISILVPVYKVENYIERCIISLINQTIDENVEIIFVNDCTPDRSIEVLQNTIKNNPPKSNFNINIIHHQKNRGQAAARNTALNHAKGKYTLFIDSDDYIDLDMVEKMYKKAIESSASIIMVDLIKEYKDHNALVEAPYYKDKNNILSSFIRGESIYLCNKLILKSLYTDNKLSFREGYNMSEDYAIMIPLSFNANKIEYVPNTYYHYIQYNEDATTKKKLTKQDIDGWLYSVECLKTFLQNIDSNLYQSDILFRMAIVKYWCMLYADKKEQHKYLKLYPEINSNLSMFLSKFNGKHTKIKFYLVAKGYQFLFNLFVYASKLLKYEL